MTNILILGKYGVKKAIERLVKIADTTPNIVVKIIIKEGDDAPESDLIARHHRNMKGDVCDILWEASSLDQASPLVIASERGFISQDANNIFPKEIKAEIKAEEIRIFCPESTFAKFKFDADNRVCESADLPSSVPYIIEFDHTETFTKAAKSIILQHKSDKDGNFDIRSVVNQLILQNIHIQISTTKFSE